MRSTNDFDTKLGQRLVEVRLSKGYSRLQLAEKIGVTHQQLQKYEKAHNRISASRLNDICKAFDMDISTFLKGINEASGSETSRLTIELVRSFKSVPSEGIRKHIAWLVKELARPQDAVA